MTPIKPHTTSKLTPRQIRSDLDYHAAMRLMLPGLAWDRHHEPPIEPYWETGHTPPDSLDIDRQVSDLKKTRDAWAEKSRNPSRLPPKKPKTASLRPATELAKFFVSDPYLTAREFAARGFGAGRAAEMREESWQEHRPHIENRESVIQKRHARLASLLSELEDEKRHELRELRDAYRDDPLFEPGPGQIDHLISTLREASGMLADRAKQAHEAAAALKKRKPNVWLVAFTHEIGEGWHLLTGGLPSSSSPGFKSFFRATLASGGIELGDEEADHHIRKVAENAAHNEMRRFDRFSNPSPGLNPNLSTFLGRTAYSHHEGETTHHRIGPAGELPPWSGETRKSELVIIETVRDMAASIVDAKSSDEDKAAATLAISNLLDRCKPRLKKYLEYKLETVGIARIRALRSGRNC